MHNQPQLRLSIFLPSLSGGGAERVVFNLIQGFSEYNIHLELVVAYQDGIWHNQLPSNCSLVVLNKKHVLQCLFPLIRYIRKNSPDILFSAIDHANLVNILACKLSAKPVKNIISIHQVSSEFRKLHKNRKEKLLNQIINWVFPFSDKIVAVSEKIQNDLLHNITGVKDKVVVIGNPIITEAQLEGALYVEKSGVKSSVIVAFGRLAIEKDFDMLIRSFHLLLRNMEAQLIIYGEGPHRKKLESLCRELNVENSVSLPGFVDDVLEKLQQSDLCVVSSITEGFGNVIVEALACGIPVVSTDCGGPREILQDGKYGVLVPVGDEEAMKNAMLESLSRKHNPVLLQIRARDFTIEKITSEYMVLFNRLMAQGGS